MPPHVYNPLFTSRTISLMDFQCGCPDPATGPEESTGTHSITFPRTGLFLKHVGRRPIVADPNQAIFFNADETYRISHPTACADTCTVLEFKPPALADLMADLDPSIADRPSRPFRFAHCPTSPEIHWSHRAALAALLQAKSRDKAVGAAAVDSLEIEERLLKLAHRILRAAYGVHGSAPRARRDDTRMAHRTLVADTQLLLTERHAEKLDLTRIAKLVHSSPFHLSRLFRRVAGLPIHRYLNRIRLRAGLERLLSEPADLTAVALDAGFSSHSHFTESFRREFRLTPSDARRTLASGDLSTLSKCLNA